MPFGLDYVTGPPVADLSTLSGSKGMGQDYGMAEHKELDISVSSADRSRCNFPEQYVCLVPFGLSVPSNGSMGVQPSDGPTRR